ncbi:hypothetical protein PIROE2DRAFT_29409, partial [Piromyces sp. E2]
VSFFQLYRYTTIKEKLMMVIGFISASIVGCILPVTINVIGDLMSVFTDLVKIDDIFHNLYQYLLIFGLISIVSFCVCFVFVSMLSIVSSRQTIKIRSLVFNSLLRQEIAWHEKNSPGELASRIISDTLLIEEGIGMKAGVLIQYISGFIASFAIAFWNGWKLTLWILIILPFLIIIGLIMLLVGKKYTQKSQDALANVGGIAQEAFSQIRTIVSFGNEQKEIDRYTEKLKPTKKYGIIKSHFYGICVGAIFAVIYFSYGIAFVKSSEYIHDDNMKGGDVLKVFLCVIIGAQLFSNCSTVFNSFTEASGAASKLFHIIERQPKIDTDESTSPKKELKGTVEFRNVHFTYPSRPDVEVLKGINFKCNPGQTVALVGASGSGKSTIVQLLERYYQKRDGDILIDDQPIEDYNIHWLRSQICLVSQEPALFDASIAENISIAYPGATMEQIEKAAKLANAHDFISKLPNGYQTNTGERGLMLSGGQKQRICIARALINNPKILLLDEATSALDNQSEKLVQSSLDSASKRRTTIVIAHRLTTIKNADVIIVMEKGKIIESGTHDDLMAKENIYYNLVKSQEIEMPTTIEKSYMNMDDMDDMDEIDDIDDIDDLINEDNQENDYESETSLSIVNSDISEYSLYNKKFNASNENKELKKISKDKKKGSMNWKRFFSYNKSIWWANLLGILGSIVIGSIKPAFAYIFASAMSIFNEQGEQLLKDGKLWGFVFVILGLVYFISYYFQVGGFSISGEHLSYIFRKDMYNSMIRQEIGFFDTNDIESNSNSGTLTAKLSTEASLVQGLNLNLGYIFEVAVTIIAGFGIAFYNGWKLTLILLGSVPFLFIGIYFQMYSGKKVHEVKHNIIENSTKVAVEALSNIKIVYSLNLEDRFKKSYNDSLSVLQKSLEHKHVFNSVGYAFSNSIIFFAYGIGFYFGALFIKNGNIEFKNMFRVLLAIILTATGLGKISTIGPDFNKAMKAFGQVVEIIDRKPKIDASDPKGIKKEYSLEGDISFKGLRFRYPSRPHHPVLRWEPEDRVEVPRGKVLALVGESGCGKSTLVGLLLRWYDPHRGEILVDNEKNVDYNIQWLRSHIGIVNQEPGLFNISIKENIRYGKKGASDEEIVEAAKKANIHDFIVSLPQGYDTMVGGLNTSQMSGGQKQRIAIARALIRNPKILLLDEATSALDAESEQMVQKALDEASQGRTTIIIAHRLSTVKDADIIVVMKQGKIIEHGNHEELMANKGEYYEMV